MADLRAGKASARSASQSVLIALEIVAASLATYGETEWGGENIGTPLSQTQVNQYHEYIMNMMLRTPYYLNLTFSSACTTSFLASTSTVSASILTMSSAVSSEVMASCGIRASSSICIDATWGGVKYQS